MKKLLRTSLFLGVLFSGTVFFTTLPKESRADVIATGFHKEYRYCPQGFLVIRCQYGGPSCNVSSQVLCDEVIL